MRPRPQSRRAAQHQFFIERGAVRQVTDPLVGTIDIPGFPIKFSDAPPDLDLPTHALGQDNAEVLQTMLGYDDQRSPRSRLMASLPPSSTELHQH